MNPKEPILQLDDRFTHLVSAGDGHLLVGDDEAFFLETSVAPDVIRHLNGEWTGVGIAEALRDHHPPELIHFLLLLLEKEGLVKPWTEDRSPPFPGGSEWDGEGETGILAWTVMEAWNARGSRSAVRVELGSHSSSLPTLLLTDDYLVQDLLPLQEEMGSEGGGFLLAGLGSRRVWLGPSLYPGVTACISCLQERLRINLMARALLHLPPGSGVEAGSGVERLNRRIPRGAFLRLAEALDRKGWEPGQEGESLRVLPLGNEPEEDHPVARLPHCSVCGDPTLEPPGASIALSPTSRIPLQNGGYRSKSPDETINRLTPHISPLTGVIRHVRKVPVEGAELVHVYTANYAHCYNAASIKTLRADRRDHGGGKGMSDAEARVSAICESVERFSSVYRGTENLETACLSTHESDAVHPNDLSLFSEAQYRGRDHWNETDPSGFHYVPEPYEDETIEWSNMWSLSEDRVIRVPSACLYLGFKGEGNRFCKGDSNGLASGNCLEEAILQGFLELVERDGVALWWYNRVARPGVDLGSFNLDPVQQTVELYPRLNRTLWVLDLSTDLGIPTFAALSALLDGPREDIIFGFGAHLDPEIALLRALSELNQMLPTILQSPENRRAQLLPDFGDAIDWWDSAKLDSHPYLLPAAGTPDRIRSGFETPTSHDLRENVLECVARARKVGCQVLVHDLTRPDVGFPVVRVTVPGLRHFWRRLGPGRLFEAPVRLGWMDEPVAEEDMNPISVFV